MNEDIIDYDFALFTFILRCSFCVLLILLYRHTAMKLFIETWELLFPLSNCANTWFIIITICGVPCKAFSFFRKEKTCMLSFDKKFWTRYSHDKLFRVLSYTDFYTLSMIIPSYFIGVIQVKMLGWDSIFRNSSFIAQLRQFIKWQLF